MAWGVLACETLLTAHSFLFILSVYADACVFIDGIAFLGCRN